MSQLAFTIDAAKIHEALSFVINCVDTRTTQPILGHILIQSEGSGIRVSSTDLDVSVSMVLEAKVTEPGALAVIGKPLLAQFAGRTGDAVISTTPNDRMRVKVGSSSALLVGLKASNFPELPKPVGDPVLAIGAARFSTLLRRVAYATGAQWEFIRITPNGGGVFHLDSTDGHRMARCTEETTQQFKPMSIPNAMSTLIMKYRWPMSDEARLYDAANVLHFATDSVCITSRQVVGMFPDASRVLSVQNKNFAVIPKMDLAAAIASSAMFTNRGKEILPALQLSFSDSSLTIKASNGEVGDYESSIPCIGAADLSFGMNPTFISQFLSSVDEESVTFLLGKSASNAVEMRPGDGSSDACRCVAMPMRA